MSSMILTLNTRLPGLNEILEARATVKKIGKQTVWNAYMDMKRDWGREIAARASLLHFRVPGPGYFTYILGEIDRRRDPGNVSAGAQKIIEDGLQEAGLLAGDGWQDVLGFVHHWTVVGGSGSVTLIWRSDRVLSKEEALKELY